MPTAKEQREYAAAQKEIHRMRMTEAWPKLLHAKDALPCPFCGAPAEIEPWHAGPATKRLISCSNEDCAIQPSACADTEAAALGDWNRRAKGTD